MAITEDIVTSWAKKADQYGLTAFTLATLAGYDLNNKERDQIHAQLQEIAESERFIH